MKHASLVLTIALVIGAIAWSIWTYHKTSISKLAKPVNLHPPSVEIVMSKNWQELRATRETTFKGNPDLVGEYQKLLAEIADQQKAMDRAMIKADPKVAAIVAKQDSTDRLLSPLENRELNIARQAARRANPDLVATSLLISEKISLYRAKFSQALLKTDPKVAPMLARLGEDDSGLK